MDPLFVLLNVKSCHTQLPPQDLTFSTLIPQEESKNSQKLKTQRMKILTQEETFVISTALVPIIIKITKNLLRAPLL